MRVGFTPCLLAIALAGTAGCSGEAATGGSGGQATVSIGTANFAVSKVTFTYATGENGYFRIEGDDGAHPTEDCLPGLSGGLALYGELPSDVSDIKQLSGRELPLEFTGDGDDFNLCFVGSNGLLGVEQGTVRFTVNGDQVAFTFSGSFRTYDGEGGESPAATAASGSGTASILAE